jgi:hypothetical protein
MFHDLKLDHSRLKKEFKFGQFLALVQYCKSLHRSSTTLKECVEGYYEFYRQCERLQYRLLKSQKKLRR